MVELILRSDPDPKDRFAGSQSDSSRLFVDSYGPKIFVRLELLESQRRMLGFSWDNFQAVRVRIFTEEESRS